jgi:ribose/xylose/arabinose/galactoside ABC-type transport system permease subunit
MKKDNMRIINPPLSVGKLSNESYLNLVMFFVLIVLFGFGSIFIKNYFSVATVLNIIANNWYIVILGIGVTFLLVSGHLDMSIGGTVAMAGVLSAFFCQTQNPGFSELGRGLNLPYGVAVILTLACCLVIGLINALFVAKMRVASIIVTLGTMLIARGIGQVAALGAQRSAGLPDIYGVIGNTPIIGPIKIAAAIALLLVLIALFFEKKTVFGRRTYLIGANREAARLSGLKVDRHIALLYMLNSLLAGITGILLASEMKAGISTRGTGFEFSALVVTLLGGASIDGGIGSVLGMVIGAFILGVVSSAAYGLLLRPEWQYILTAIVTFLAIIAQRYLLYRRGR